MINAALSINIRNNHSLSSSSSSLSARVFSSSSRQWRAVRSRLPDWKLWVRDHVVYFSLSCVCACMCVCVCVCQHLWCFSFSPSSRLVCTRGEGTRRCVFFRVSQSPHLCSHKCSLESCGSLAGLQTGASWVGGSLSLALSLSLSLSLYVSLSVSPLVLLTHLAPPLTYYYCSVIYLHKHQNIVVDFFFFFFFTGLKWYFYIQEGQTAVNWWLFWFFFFFVK